MTDSPTTPEDRPSGTPAMPTWWCGSHLPHPPHGWADARLGNKCPGILTPEPTTPEPRACRRADHHEPHYWAVGGGLAWHCPGRAAPDFTDRLGVEPVDVHRSAAETRTATQRRILRDREEAIEAERRRMAAQPIDLPTMKRLHEEATARAAVYRIALEALVEELDNRREARDPSLLYARIDAAHRALAEPVVGTPRVAYDSAVERLIAAIPAHVVDAHRHLVDAIREARA